MWLLTGKSLSLDSQKPQNCLAQQRCHITIHFRATSTVPHDLFCKCLEELGRPLVFLLVHHTEKLMLTAHVELGL